MAGSLLTDYFLADGCCCWTIVAGVANVGEPP